MINSKINRFRYFGYLEEKKTTKNFNKKTLITRLNRVENPYCI